MYNVMILDDEPWSIISLKNAFNWERYCFKIEKEFLDPYNALKSLEDNHIDVIFLDIRMPEMSGLDFIENVKKRKADIEFVIVSGYSDFPYAKRAIEYGVFDYCLKPIEEDKTDNLLKRLSEKLNNKQQEKDIELIDKLMESGTRNNDDIPLYIFNYSYDWYMSAVTYGLADLMNLFLPDFSDMQYKKITVDENKIFYLLNAPKDRLYKFQNAIKIFSFQKDIVIGLSSIAQEAEMATLLTESDFAAYSLKMSKNSGVNIYQSLDISWVNRISEYVIKKIQCLNIDDVFLELSSLDAHPHNMTISEATLLWNQITSFISKDLDEDDNYNLEFLSDRDFCNHFENYSHAMEELKYVIKSIYQNKQVDINAADSSAGMIDFVKDNYNKELSLKTLADTFHLNFTYCSELFKKSCGVTFSQYVTNLRMEKAKYLLDFSRYSIKEIAEKVGYVDYFYFATVFKKYYKSSPSQYKRNEKTL